MTINVFGQKIEVPKINPEDEVNQIVVGLLKRREEREIALELMDGQSVEGKQRKAELVEKVHLKAQQDKTVVSKSVLVDFVIKKLKESQIGKHTLYEDLVMRVIEAQGRFRVSDFARALRLDKVDAQKAPYGFVGEHKEAESVLVGKISSEVDEETRQEYLTERYLAGELREITQDLFYAVNKGASKQETAVYMAVVYELRKLQTREPTNKQKLFEKLLVAIKEKTPLDLIHVKCLRFVYPLGQSVKVLDHTEEETIITKTCQKYVIKGEKDTFSKLEMFVGILNRFGVGVNLKILLNDYDLTDHFPDSRDSCFMESDLALLPNSVQRYRRAVGSLVGNDFVELLSEYMERFKIVSSFTQERQRVKRQFGQGTDLPKDYVEEKIEYRYKFSQLVFAHIPSKDYVRKRVQEELATMQALSVLVQTGNVILIEKDMGNDSSFIGGHKQTALPVFFMDLGQYLGI